MKTLSNFSNFDNAVFVSLGFQINFSYLIIIHYWEYMGNMVFWDKLWSNKLVVGQQNVNLCHCHYGNCQLAYSHIDPMVSHNSDVFKADQN